MFINFWYAAELSSVITDKPVKARMLGQDFVLFRDTRGQVQCLSNTCVHRGGSLADGKVRGNCIACPYHGWQFTGTGECTRIPSLGPKATIPGRARVDAYPTQERYGVVFVFLGDLPEDQRPPILEMPEWEQDGWQVLSEVFDWKVNFQRSVENSLDAPHAEFVHEFGSGQGNGKVNGKANEALTLEAEKSWVEERGEWSTAHVIQTKTLVVEHGHIGISHTWTFLKFGAPEKPSYFRFYTFITPVDEDRVRRFFFHARNILFADTMRNHLLEGNRKAEQEDRLIVEKLRPAVSGLGTAHEFMVEDDRIMILYREKLRDWDARGWRIDSDTVTRNARRVAYAIPSPARRQQKGWVLDPVPLTPASAPSVS